MLVNVSFSPLSFSWVLLPYAVFSAGRSRAGWPVRSHPSLSGHNWCLIRRGCDKLVSELSFSQGIEPRLLCGVVEVVRGSQLRVELQ